METSSVSGKTALLSKTLPNHENAQQRQTAAEGVATKTAESDSVSLSAQALQLAKSVGTTNDSRVPVIENPDQARLATQKIVELLRQRGDNGVIGQAAIHAGKFKALLI